MVRARGVRWCSMACRMAVVKTATKDCRQCGAPFVPVLAAGRSESRWCSRRCWVAWKAAYDRVLITYTCPACNKPFQRRRATGKHVYCSRACHGQGRTLPGTTGHRGTGWRKIAAATRDRDDHRCVRCGVAELHGLRMHAVDHMIPWRLLAHLEELANADANLATLCHPCHGMKTTVTEPRMLRGDWMALDEFYGPALAAAAIAAAAPGFVMRAGDDSWDEMSRRHDPGGT